MKRKLLFIIWAILIIATTNDVFSQIENHGNIELGWKDGLYQYFYDHNRVSQFQFPANSFYADINLNFKWKFLAFNQVIGNNFYYKQGRTFKPIDVEFKSTLSLDFDKIEIGYTHLCLHPVIGEKNDLEYGYRRNSEDCIFIRFKW
jgi:hypothetical protein